MYCPECQQEHPDGVEFCPTHGRKLVVRKKEERVDPMIGSLLQGRYRITGVVGAGAMGTVYRAEQINVDREVAVKFLTHDAGNDEDSVQRFEREAKVLAKLHHPNSLTLFDFGHTDEGRCFVVTELLHGSPLDEILKKGPLDVPRTLQVVGEVCEALGEAHDLGVVHRDLKPGNLFFVEVGKQQVVKVLDFGIARLVDDVSATATGTVLGTASYMSPQQAQGVPVDARSDIYSLGIIAYECVAWNTPFAADSVVGMLMKHVTDTPQPLSERDPPIRVPKELEALIMRMLDKDPDARPQTAAEVREEVLSIERRLALGGTPMPSPKQHPLSPDDDPEGDQPTMLSQPPPAKEPSLENMGTDQTVAFGPETGAAVSASAQISIPTRALTVDGEDDTATTVRPPDDSPEAPGVTPEAPQPAPATEVVAPGAAIPPGAVATQLGGLPDAAAGSRRLVYGLAAGGVVLALAAAGWFVLGGSKEPAPAGGASKAGVAPARAATPAATAAKKEPEKAPTPTKPAEPAAEPAAKAEPAAAAAPEDAPDEGKAKKKRKKKKKKKKKKKRRKKDSPFSRKDF